MKKSTMIKILTIPWIMRIIKALWNVENHPEVFGSLLQTMAVIGAVIICGIVIMAAFTAANECDEQDIEILRLRAKK